MRRHALFALLGAGRGRALSLVLLVIGAVTLAYLDATPLTAFRQLLFDRYQRIEPRRAGDTPVLVVGIDETSLARYGQWPWPRDLVAELIDRINEGQPKAIGIDILFAEPDRYTPALLARRIPELRGHESTLPDPDARLATILGSSPTILGIAGTQDTGAAGRIPFHHLPDDFSLPAAQPHFAGATASLPQLQEASLSEGLINQRSEGPEGNLGIVRAVPLFGRIGDAKLAALGLEMLRQADAGALAITAGPTLRVGSAQVPIAADGAYLPHFSHFRADRYRSAAQVLAGDEPPAHFRNQLVLIAFTAGGLVDQVVTPLGERVPGVDVHLQVIENLLTGDGLRRPAWMPKLELAVYLVCGLFLLFAVPALRPRLAAMLGALLALALFGVGLFAFRFGHWLFDAASVFFLLNPLFISLLGYTLIAADRHRRSAERDLQTSREAAARINGELDAARRIQLGLVPDPATCFEGETRFAVAALLEPARAVGGDYYDCFMLDAQRLCVTIGDVSGKGIPASLFMAITKTLTGTLARRDNDLGAAVRAVESELTRENPELLFVTAFVAVLDVGNGNLEFVCAGHDAPILLRDGAAAPIDTRTTGGPPLCVLGDFPYLSAGLQLQQGDLLCLHTDGVTEASDGKELFGSERLLATLRDNTAGSPAQQVAAIRAAVRVFEAGQPPADDLTLLLLRWQGPNADAPG
jgi:adenylate cyclase